MTTREAFIAVNRFGLGARPGELAEAAGDPKGWIEAQLAGRVTLPPPLDRFPASRKVIADFQKTRQAARQTKDKSQFKALRKALRQSYLKEAAVRTRVQIETRQPVAERLVAFWSNHFTVSGRKAILAGIAGAYEREAIRPHVTGRFADMLRAVVRHPAMLFYLDNAQSIGPNSKAGRRRNRGLNENLAREILELHTLGVNGGYTQADVREFAKMLTGWSIGRPRLGNAGAFAFFDRAHEPGPKLLLGRRYQEDGIREAEAALAALARHPATARHIAFKLARHFVADQPPEALVTRLTKVFLDTDGDLGALMRAIVRSKEAWAEPLPKVKTPNEFVVSVLRAVGFEGGPRKLVGALRLLGQMPYFAPSPAGWPDEAAKWVSPEALLQRAELAMALARRSRGRIDSIRLLRDTIGPVAAASTRTAIQRAPNRVEAVATVFASPEFQRR
jgi:uncharacterized protein (DUF1800 family)